MFNEAVLPASATAAVPSRPTVRKIVWSDLTDALRQGFADFSAKPSHTIFLCIIYPVVGLLIARVAMRSDLLPLLFPLAAGFALLGPFAAIGLYELSRRREQGQDSSWARVFEVARSPSLGAIGEVGLVMMIIFLAWLGAAQLIYDLTLGPALPVSIAHFAGDLFTRPAGWMLILFGNAVGFVFAAVALTVGVVSLPLLVDRNVGFVTALSTSARCVAMNPLMLSLWGLMIAAALFVGSIPFFVGLAVVLPVLGHATWHLYRKLVV